MKKKKMNKKLELIIPRLFPASGLRLPFSYILNPFKSMAKEICEK